MQLTTIIPVIATLAATASAQQRESRVTITTFSTVDCQAPIGSFTLSDRFCTRISSGGFTAFRFSNLNLQPGCRVTFNNNDRCTELFNPIDVNSSQCFRSSNGINTRLFANIFCS